tara:strand:- start:512 stop:1642 length:1131 start_codon:yes stop_codon:yes gene_type:complete
MFHPAMAWQSLPVVRKALTELNSNIPQHLIGIHGFLFDVSDFKHPGGNIFTHASLGTDATALFHAHHLDFKKALSALKRVPQRGAYKQTVRYNYADYENIKALYLFNRGVRKRAFPFYAWAWFSLAVGLHVTQCLSPNPGWFAPAAFASTVAGGYGHNGVHVMSPEALLLDWNGLSSYEWLFEHIMSHHMHTNTERDHDAISMEPFIRWLPHRLPQGLLLDRHPTLAFILEHVLYCVAEIVVAFNGIFIHRTRWQFANPHAPAWLKCAPFLFIIRVTTLCYFRGVLMTLMTLAMASYMFSYLAHLNHERHLLPRSADNNFYENQRATTRNIGNPFGLPASWTLFLDRQVMHHLFPTINHPDLMTTHPSPAQGEKNR